MRIIISPNNYGWIFGFLELVETLHAGDGEIRFICFCVLFAVSEVAEKIIWNCLVEDPILFLRHFLEKLTHKDKYVSSQVLLCFVPSLQNRHASIAFEILALAKWNIFTVFIRISASERCNSQVLKLTLLRQNLGKYTKFQCLKAILGGIWPSFPQKKLEGVFIRINMVILIMNSP